MTINIKLITAVFLTLDLLVILFSLYMGFDWLINTQTAILGSLLIVIGSFLGYRKMVKVKAEVFSNEPDIIEKIEDPYGIWDEDDKPSKTPSVKSAAKNVKTTARGFLSPYRIISYMLFCVLFLILVKSGSFLFIPFAIGVGFIPLWVFVCGIFISFANKRR